MFMTYVRSSSYGCSELCEHKFFLVYNLGLDDKVSKKTEMGSIYHKVMELLAKVNLAKKNKQDSFSVDEIGELRVEDCDPDHLTDISFRLQSKTRPDLDWSLVDLKECKKWVEKGLEYNNGEFNPLKYDIIDVEKYFDFEIDKDWARYEYNFLNGETVKGQLGCKGTIDNIVKVDDNTLHIIDYKTGARKNWATGEEKTFDKLAEDFQFQFYYYAVSRLYPQYEYCLASVFYVNSGGGFTFTFDKSDIPKIENKIRAKFEHINRTQKPALNLNVCGFCNFSRKGGNYKDTNMSTCEFFRNEIQSKGLDLVMLEHGDTSKLVKYSEGGGRIHNKE